VTGLLHDLLGRPGARDDTDGPEPLSLEERLELDDRAAWVADLVEHFGPAAVEADDFEPRGEWTFECWRRRRHEPVQLEFAFAEPAAPGDRRARVVAATGDFLNRKRGEA
jgi:hypothetical protein